MNYLQRRRNAFFYAFQGLGSAIRREAHMKIHLAAAIVVILAGQYFSVTVVEWIILIFAIAFVIVSELINTAIEKLCDLAMPQPHPVVKYIKDISAAAVLVSCLAAVAAGGFVFYPYLKQIF